jgi:hypothetical protein
LAIDQYAGRKTAGDACISDMPDLLALIARRFSMKVVWVKLVGGGPVPLPARWRTRSSHTLHQDTHAGWITNALQRLTQ